MKIKSPNPKLYLLLALLAFTSAQISQAQQPADALPLNGAIVNSANANSYKALIPQELYAYVRSGALELNLEEKLSYETIRDQDWIKQSKENAQHPNTLPPKLTRGMPFGLVQDLVKESDQQKLGQKLLWNSLASFAGLGVLDLDFTLLGIKDGSMQDEIRGTIVRLYPAMLFPDDRTNQVFREQISLKQPTIFSGFDWLTFRFFGEDEDAFWLHSPAIKKTRQLTGSNRADSILGTSFSLDDLFTWSGKPELLEIRSVQQLRLLTPFPALESARLKKNSAGCYEVSQYQNSNDERAIGARFARSVKRSAATNWLPFIAIFVPRQVWRIELESKDPFSLYGRQVLYLDRDTMLPVYKFVYGRGGQHWKSVISSYGYAITGDRQHVVPFMTTSLVHDRIKQQANIMDLPRITYCENLPEYLKLSDFDPHKLGPGE